MQFISDPGVYELTHIQLISDSGVSGLTHVQFKSDSSVPGFPHILFIFDLGYMFQFDSDHYAAASTSLIFS